MMQVLHIIQRSNRGSKTRFWNQVRESKIRFPNQVGVPEREARATQIKIEIFRKQSKSFEISGIAYSLENSIN